jgi:hypothetical protein
MINIINKEKMKIYQEFQRKNSFYWSSKNLNDGSNYFETIAKLVELRQKIIDVNPYAIGIERIEKVAIKYFNRFGKDRKGKVKKGSLIDYSIGDYETQKFTWICDKCGKEYFSRNQAQECRARGHAFF